MDGPKRFIGEFVRRTPGYEFDGLIGKSFLNVFFDPNEKPFRNIQKCLANLGQTFNGNYARCGKRAHDLGRERRSRWSVGSSPRLIVFEDITDWKRPRKRSQKARSSIGHDAIFVRDSKDVITYWNSARRSCMAEAGRTIGNRVTRS